MKSDKNTFTKSTFDVNIMKSDKKHEKHPKHISPNYLSTPGPHYHIHSRALDTIHIWFSLLCTPGHFTPEHTHIWFSLTDDRPEGRSGPLHLAPTWTCPLALAHALALGPDRFLYWTSGVPTTQPHPPSKHCIT